MHEHNGNEWTDFYTTAELRELHNRRIKQDASPYLFNPAADKTHTYMTSHVFVDNMYCGTINIQDINTPITKGQEKLVIRINELLTLYFQSNHVYLRAADSKDSFYNKLLYDAKVSEEIVDYHLKKMKWAKNDCLYLLIFDSRHSKSHQESVVNIKLVSSFYPKAIVTIFEDKIVCAIRAKDYDITGSAEQARLTDFLFKREMLCGISTKFRNFMLIRHYFEQANFALTACESSKGKTVMFYESCQREHILKLLSKTADLRSLCHPEILELWGRGDGNERELVHCLYAYLINGKNLAAAAKALRMHRSTFVYKVDKLSSILGEDFDKLTLDKSFFYIFSCLIVLSEE